VMQYVEHGPLARLRPDGSVETPAQLPPPEATLGGPISPVDLAHYADQMVSGLQYLHRRGILHRDLKPDNILLGAHDTVYLSDFGLSTLVEDTDAQLSAGGTTAFMAPELLDPEAFGESPNVGPTVTPAADVWALGVTLYVLLYGKLPWQTAGVSRSAVVRQILREHIEFPPMRRASTETSASVATQHTATVSDLDSTASPRAGQLTAAPSALTPARSNEPTPPLSSMDRSNPRQHHGPWLDNADAPHEAVDSLPPPADDARVRDASGRDKSEAEESRNKTLAARWATLLREMLTREPSARLSLDGVSAALQRFVASEEEEEETATSDVDQGDVAE